MTSTAPASVPASTAAASAPAERKYKFLRSDFGPLEAKPLHLHLYFDIIESRVVVTNHTTFVYQPAAGQPSTATLSSIKLNSNELDISSVERISQFTPLEHGANSAATHNAAPTNIVAHTDSFNAPTTLQYALHKDDDILEVQLDEPVQAGKQFVIKLVTIATPTSHILEGLYYDYTPSNCPRTIITQCQQYGFQRITPCMDYMTAKVDAHSYSTHARSSPQPYTMRQNHPAPAVHSPRPVLMLCRRITLPPSPPTSATPTSSLTATWRRALSPRVASPSRTRRPCSRRRTSVPRRSSGTL